MKMPLRFKSIFLPFFVICVLFLNVIPVLADYSDFTAYRVDRYTITSIFPGANKKTSDKNILFKITDTNNVSTVRVWAVNTKKSTISDTYYMKKGNSKTISFSKGTYPTKGQWVSAEYKNDSWSASYGFMAGGIDYK